MFKEFKSYSHEILLLVLVVAFIIIKIPYLSLPYYWDEAWVYGPAVRIMEVNGLSLLPGGLHAYFSKGHPLLFHFLGALWLRIFGTSLFSSHSFALFISVALIVSVYFIGKKIFNKNTGIIASVVLTLQPVFVAQSVMVLPEIMLSLFSLLSIFYLIRGNWKGYILFAVCALFTKETGVVVIAAAGVWFIIETYLKSKNGEFNLKDRAIDLFYVTCPVIPIALFFILQKQTHGWYFFPEHIGYVATGSSLFFQRMQSYAEYLFIFWGRNALSIGILVSLIILFFLKRQSVLKNKGLFILVIYICMYLFIGSLNYYSDRYTLCLMAPFVLVSVFIISSVLTNRIFLISFIVFYSAIQFFVYLPQKTSSDHNMGYANCVNVQQQMVNFCIENNYKDKIIYTPFLMGINLTDPFAGYIKTEQKFSGVRYKFDNEIRLCIFCNMEDLSTYQMLKDAGRLELIKRFETGQAWSEIYKVHE